MSDTLTNVDELQHLDFAITCSVRTCDHTADWWLVCRACEAHIPRCERCHAAEVAALAVLPPRSRVRCGNCLEQARAGRWVELFQFIPIGAA